MRNRFFILWLIWTLMSSLLVYVAVSSDPSNTLPLVISTVLSLSPLMGGILALGSVKSAEQFKTLLKKSEYSVFYAGIVLTILFAIPGIVTNTFDPYQTTIFAFVVFAVFGSMKQLSGGEFKLTWSDLVVWLLLWIPFDLRWYSGMQTGLDYLWWSQAVSAIAVIGWYGFRDADIGYDLVPGYRDIIVAFIAVLVIFLFVTPPGLLTGFLKFSLPGQYDIPKLIVHFAGLFVTVALPEELFFRGILLRGLDNLISKKWVPMAISSVSFGLMHWNNVSDLSTQITYVSLATIAGAGYGWAYRRSGNNLFAPVLTHTLVDWLWKLFLSA